MPFLSDPRRRSTALLAFGALLVFGLLGTLQWFNTSNLDFLDPETYGQTIFLTALEGLLFLLLLLLLVLLFRTVLKAYMGQGSSGLVGARLRSRMVLGAVIITVTPAALMYLFSYLLMNRSMERWFSPNPSELRDDSMRVVLELSEYVASNARGEAESIASSGALSAPPAKLQQVLAAHRVTLQGGFVEIYDKDRRLVGGFQAPPENTPVTVLNLMDPADQKGTPAHGLLSAILLSSAQRTDLPTLQIGNLQYGLGMAAGPLGKIVVTALPMPQGLNEATARIRAGADEYWKLFRSRNRPRTMLFLMLLLITVFVFFTSVWLAVFLSKQITRPVEALADAMDEIAAGKYSHRVDTMATGEMADLIRSFNHMAADLDASRQLAESTQAQLTAANQSIEQRRRELEIIVETIPSGVVTLDGSGIVLQSNRAFSELMARTSETTLVGERVDDLFPVECADEVASLIRRGQRMGAASAEMECPSRGRTLHLAMTSARLELTQGRPGTVLVVEDTTDLLRAQRQLAWKEVAQRVAHEIKNPLTPIALSAERIGRHLDRGQPDSTGVIRRCSEVILGCVGTLRSLVDQFSALAQFPATQPRPCCVNEVADQALALFSGRLEGITLQRHLEPGLPLVMADPEALRRALANLIDNAAEAMQGSLLRVLGIRTAVSEDGTAVEIVVSDTGHGITDEIRERLFLPFYSTKHRGTGLGLAIAAKIVQEHGGSIRAESNTPKGARFLLRLPLMESNVHPAEASTAAAHPANGSRS
jgi:two-component system nitrogen regulation sensor histidine kinase NtrY